MKPDSTCFVGTSWSAHFETECVTDCDSAECCNSPTVVILFQLPWCVCCYLGKMLPSNVTGHVLRLLKKSSVRKPLVLLLLKPSIPCCPVSHNALYGLYFTTISLQSQYLGLMSGIVLQLLHSVCLALLPMVQKTVSRKKENTLFAASCSLHTSACALAASLDSSWFAGQYPDGRFITSNKSLAPCEHLRGISDHVASFSFRKGSSNYLWILGFTMLSSVFRSVIFGVFASRKQRYLRYVRLSVQMYSDELYRVGFPEISNLGLCWLKARASNEDLRSRMISRHDWSS